jgi:hypothetical protein
MTIKPYDGLTRYHVDSETNPNKDPYLVDLEIYRGNGLCACDDFRYNHEPKVARGATPSDETRCKHLKAVRELLAYQLLDTFLRKQMQTNAQERKAP